jgi:hypothetical protein
MEDVKSEKMKIGDMGLGNISRSKELSGARLLSRATAGKRGDKR